MSRNWKHAVLTVDVVIADGRWTYHARAWLGESEIYNQTRDTMFWSGPLADLARRVGVGVDPQYERARGLPRGGHQWPAFIPSLYALLPEAAGR